MIIRERLPLLMRTSFVLLLCYSKYYSCNYMLFCAAPPAFGAVPGTVLLTVLYTAQEVRVWSLFFPTEQLTTLWNPVLVCFIDLVAKKRCFLIRFLAVPCQRSGYPVHAIKYPRRDAHTITRHVYIPFQTSTVISMICAFYFSIFAHARVLLWRRLATPALVVTPPVLNFYCLRPVCEQAASHPSLMDTMQPGTRN